jgi:PilZ domain
MGRRSEQRIAVSVPVVVHGANSRGAPFSMAAETYDISLSGACVKGLANLVEPGMKIQIQNQDQKAWYRVQWISKNGGPKGGCIGVRCLEQGKYIWGIPPLEWKADTFDPSVPPPFTSPTVSSWSGPERRRFERHVCRIDAQVTLAGDPNAMAGKVADISLGGCYIEMFSPMAVGSAVKLILGSKESSLQISGKIRTSHPGIGMGVSFTGMGEEDFEKLQRVVPAGSDVAAAKALYIENTVPLDLAGAPPVSVYSGASMAGDLDLPTRVEGLEAIVRLLLRKGIFTRDEIAKELDKLQATKILQ